MIPTTMVANRGNKQYVVRQRHTAVLPVVLDYSPLIAAPCINLHRGRASFKLLLSVVTKNPCHAHTARVVCRAETNRISTRLSSTAAMRRNIAKECPS